MINKAILVGRLTKDIELRKTQSGKSVASFTVAVDSGYGDKKKTDFINCVAWEKTAEILSQYASKGTLISVEGKIQPSNYEKVVNGEAITIYKQDVIAHQIDILEWKEKTQNQTYQKQEEYYEEKPEPVIDISQDDLPF